MLRPFEPRLTLLEVSPYELVVEEELDTRECRGRIKYGSIKSTPINGEYALCESQLRYAVKVRKTHTRPYTSYA